MASFGAADAIASFGLGRLSDLIGRVGLILFGLALQFGVAMYLYFVVPLPSGAYVTVFVCAVLWGIGDGVFNTLLSALLGAIFPRDIEAAFSNLKLWQAIASAAMFGLGASNKVTFQDISILVMSISAFSFLIFAIFSWLFRFHGVNRNKADESDIIN